MDDIIKIVELPEKSGLLTDGASETIKHKIKKTRKWICQLYDGTYGCFIGSTYGFFFNTTCAFFIDKCYNWKRSKEHRIAQKGSFIPLLALPLMMKVL